MIVLKVPYSEKDEAKALGARWNKERKIWYVPDGVDGAPFKRWVAPGNAAALAGSSPAPAAKSARVDSLPGKTSVGAHYVKLDHDCNPFLECPECRVILQASGWSAQQLLVKQMLASLGTSR